MIRNYLRTALRNLNRNRTYALINVLGLAMGIACAVLIFSLVSYHLGFDQFHEKKDRVYRVLRQAEPGSSGYDPGVPPPLGKAFHNEYPFTESVANVAVFENVSVSFPFSEDKKFREEEGIAFAEPDFFNILDYPMVQGGRHTVLAEPNTAVITERAARRYFGSGEAIGQTIRIVNRFNNHKLDFRIRGILQDLPLNTGRRQEIYLSYTDLGEFHGGFADNNWHQTSRILQCFFLLKPGVSPVSADSAFAVFSEKHYDRANAAGFRFRLQPLSDIHLNPEVPGGQTDRKSLWALALIGGLLVATACANFVNLATAQALHRSREVGVRKALGSSRVQLFWQFIAETTIIVLGAACLAAVLVQGIVPWINHLFETRLPLRLFSSGQMAAFLSMLLLLVVFLSGSYPGLILAGFHPVQALKGKSGTGRAGGFSIRKGLVVAQFAISQLLIIAALVIAGQMRYSRQADMGFRKEAIVTLPVPVRQEAGRSTLNARLAQVSGVEGVTFCSAEPASSETFETKVNFRPGSRRNDLDIYFIGADTRYLDVFDLELAAGRNLFHSDSTREYLLNQTAARALAQGDGHTLLGETIRIGGQPGQVVGIVRDFHIKSFREAIRPLCITTGAGWYGKCAVKIHPEMISAALPAIEEAWNNTFPDHVYTYDFLDEQVVRLYGADETMLKLIRLFSGIAILIGCLGLYGLVSFMADRRTREVGIRKMLGAGIGSIVWLFGKEFVRLLLLAFFIAAPLGWWAMKGWLGNFAYRIDIDPWILFLALVLTCAAAALTIGYRSVRAAMMDPVRSLGSD